MGRHGKVKAFNEPPQQAADYVVNLPQAPVRNSEEYLKAYIGYIYTAVGAIAQEVASIDLHLFKLSYVRGKPNTTEIYEHEALSVLKYVNQLSTFYDVVEATQIYLELTGEAFWVVLKDGQTPKEYWLLRPDWVKVIPSATDVIDHYNYYAGGVLNQKVEIPKENIIPFKYFNPLNPYRGKGTTQAAALPFDILNFAQEYNRNFFFNSAIPSMVFSTDQKISEATVKRFLNQWQNSFGGRSKSNKVAFLGNGMKIDKASFGAKELDFAEQMKMMRDDVLAVFKVPKTVLGLTEDVNRANADSTTRAFMERVVTPRMRKFVDTLNEFYLPMFVGADNTLFFDFTDPSPEDVELKLKKYENARKYGWMTANEIRVEENLEPIEGGDDLALSQAQNPNEEEPEENPEESPEEEPEEEPTKPTSEEESTSFRNGIIKLLGGKPVKSRPYTPPKHLVNRPNKHMVPLPTKQPSEWQRERLAKSFVEPLKKFIAELTATDEYPDLKVTKPKGNKFEDVILKALKETTIKAPLKDSEPKASNMNWTEEQKDFFWRQFIEVVTARETDIKKACQDIFSEQESIVLARLEEKNKSWRGRLGLKVVVDGVVPTLEELNKMWAVLQVLLREIYIEQGNYTMDFLGVGGQINITTEFASQYLLEYGGKLISGINETTRDNLMRELSDGYDAGESIDKLAKRVRTVFEDADKLRSEQIARTESIKASNAATVEAYRQSGVVTRKEWLAERDARACPFCLELDGKTIELNTYYAKVGDSLGGVDANGNSVTMKVEYADIGEPPAHVSCRCTTIPVIDSSMQIPSPTEEELRKGAKDLRGVGRKQNAKFQAGAQNVANSVEGRYIRGTIKTEDRIYEKATNEYHGTVDPISKVLDVNRATIIIDDPYDFNKVVDAVKDEFGEPYRVKNKFDVPGYRSGIINVKGSEGAITEIAVTTQEMWDARMVGGGDALYKQIRASKTNVDDLVRKMDEVYSEAQRKIEERLNQL